MQTGCTSPAHTAVTQAVASCPGRLTAMLPYEANSAARACCSVELSVSGIRFVGADTQNVRLALNTPAGVQAVEEGGTASAARSCS